MKILKSRKIKSLIIIPVILMVLLNVFVPTKVYATKSREPGWWDFGEKVWGTVKVVVGADTSMSGDITWDFAPGNLIKEIMYMMCGLGDVVISLLQVVMIGDADFWLSTTISNKNDNLENTNSWLYADDNDVTALESDPPEQARGNMLVYAADSGLSGGIIGHWEVPNILYSPENIFSNKIAALDANFINPNEYTSVTNSNEAKKEAQSFASVVAPTIATWYRAFRNLAIVGLLIVLVYTGIRIVIGSTAGEKAKHKERIQDWLVAFCLVFFMHFIMAAIMGFTDALINLFAESVNTGIIVAVDDGTIFRTNFTGYIRFAAQSASWKESLGYGIMYVMIIGIIVRYTWIYLKRFLYLAFFTMIAPLMALVYPLDKMSDGKAQAFNRWFKEYIVLALTQPMHLILYSALISSATTLCVKNPIYAIAVMMFISTAEKWVKQLFRMDEAKLTSTTLGDVAMLGAIAGIGKKVIGGAVSKVTNTAKKGAMLAATVATGGLAGGAAAAGGGAAAAGGGAAAAGGGAAAAGEGAAAGGGSMLAGESAQTGLLGIGGLDTFQNVAQSTADVGLDVVTGSYMDNPLDTYGDEGIDVENTDMSTDSVRNRLNVPNMSSSEEFQSENISDLDEDDINSNTGAGSSSNSNRGVGASVATGANTQNSINNNLADVIARGVQQGMATAFATKDAKDKQEQEREKEKQKREKENRDFIDASMDDSKKAKVIQGLIKGVGTAGGVLAGAVGGIGAAAMLGKEGKDFIQYGIVGAAGVGNFSHGLTTETTESYLDVFREKKRKNLEAILAVTPQEDMQDVQKAQMMRKVAGMGTRNEWDERRVVETYTYAASPEFKNIATDSDAMNRFERYMRSSTDFTQAKMEEMKKDIIEAQKVNRKITGAR